MAKRSLKVQKKREKRGTSESAFDALQYVIEATEGTGTNPKATATRVPKGGKGPGRR